MWSSNDAPFASNHALKALSYLPIVIEVLDLTKTNKSKRYNLNSFGEKVRTLREAKGLLLRQAAAFIEVDTAFLSKVERGEKKASRTQAEKLAKFLQAESEPILSLWLCDKILDAIQEDPFAEIALRLAIKNVTASK